MTINQPVEFDVVIVFSERVDENFCNFQPSDVETELANKQILELRNTLRKRFVSKLTCRAVKSGKYKSGSSYLVPFVPGTCDGTICLPINAAMKYV